MFKMLIEQQTVVVIAVQLVVVAGIAAALLMYLLRFRRHRVDIARKAVLVATCDTPPGLACALRLHQLGFRVFAACTDVMSSGAAQLRLEAEGTGRMHIIQVDTKNEEIMQSTVDYVEQNIMPDEKGLWAIVNTSYACVSGLFEWQTWSQCEEQVSENLMSTLRIAKSFVHLLRSRQGRFVSVTPLGGYPNYPGFSVYAATKAALEAFAASLQMELASHGVRVITVTPAVDYDKCSTSLTSPDCVDTMWRTMALESKRAYKKEFRAFYQRTRNPSQKKDDDGLAALISDVEDAVLSRRPANCYTSASMGTKIWMGAVNLMPNGWRKQRLLKSFERNFLNEEIV